MHCSYKLMAIEQITVDTQTMWEVGRVKSTNPLLSGKSAYNFIISSLNLRFLIYGSNQPWIMRYSSNYLLKKSQCKWTCKIQTQVV